MKLVVQRVKKAKVEVNQEVVGSIENGFLVLIGITHTDTKEIADYFEQEYTSLKFKDIENIGGGVFNVIMEDKSKPEPVKINFSMTKL